MIYLDLAVKNLACVQVLICEKLCKISSKTIIFIFCLSILNCEEIVVPITLSSNEFQILGFLFWSSLSFSDKLGRFQRFNFFQVIKSGKLASLNLLDLIFANIQILEIQYNYSQISIETSAPQQAGGFIIKNYFEISNIVVCRQKRFPTGSQANNRCPNYHYDMVKCRRNVDFEEMDTEPSTGKNDGF